MLESLSTISFSRFVKSFIPLIVISTGEIFKLHYFTEIRSLSKNANNIILYSSIWLVLQFIFSIIFGLISDKYCRKRTLIVTIAFSLPVILLLKSGMLLLAIIIDGVFCNITPVARAAYIDMSLHPKKTKSVTNTFIAQALPWSLIPLSQLIFTTYSLYLSLFVFTLSFLLVLFFFKDERDQHQKPNLKEVHLVLFKFSTLSFILFTIAFILLETNYQILAYFSETFMPDGNLRISYTLLGVGFALGCIVQRIWNFAPPYKVVNIIAFASLLVVVFGALTAFISKAPFTITFLTYLDIAFLGGIYLPAVYAAYSEHTKLHEMGFIFGILESLQTFAELIVPISLPLIVSKKDLTFAPLIIVLLVAFLLTSFKSLKWRSYEPSVS